MPDVGDILDGYRLDAVVGRGGMGTVYRATDRALETTVALKVIAPHLADDDTFARRFREEAKALARLDADGIVDVYTLRETEQALFFVMEYVAGPSLDAVLQRRGALPPASGLELLRQVLAAVGHAHASGVLHRDLKPSNILLHDGEAVITDFGLAKILASDAELTATHEQLGTVAYMSPEQIEGLRHVDPRSDLFSVGLIAYEVFTGRLPFDRSGSDFSIQRAIVEESFPPPSAFAPDVPPAVERVVLNLLSKDPSDRPPDAETVLQRLPAPSSEEALLLASAEAPASPDALSPAQWAGLATALLLVLAGTYVGVRATLGLPPLSFSAPPAPPSSAPDTVRTARASAGSSPTDTGAVPSPRRVVSSSSSPQSAAQNASRPPRPSPSPPDTASPSAAPSSAASAGPAAAAADEESAATRSSPATPTNSASPEASARPPPQGVLVVRSRPGAAAVRLQDSLVGRTPLTLADLAPGRYRVSLRQDAHRPFTTTLRVPPGDTATLSPSLAPRPAVVRLRVVPGGQLRIDGTRRMAASGNAPLVDSLSPGRHRIVVASDLGRWAAEVDLNAGERYARTIDFTQRVESAVTARTPTGTPLPNAAVLVDGSRAGYTPQRLTVRMGEHRLRIEKPGYKPVERTVLFDSDTETPIVVELSPRSPN